MSVVDNEKLMEVAKRIREMREISGFSVEEMAEKTEVSVTEYKAYENGTEDFPFTFIHKCALAFGLGITDILEGESARLKSYTVTRRGGGRQTAEEEGISIVNVAPMFKNKIAEPYFCRYDYNESLQNKPIHLTRHNGQEFDFVLSGKMKIQIGNNFEELQAGDSIYYNSSTPHGMIAVDGTDCVFCAVILPDDEVETVWEHGHLHNVEKPQSSVLPVPEDIRPAPDYMKDFIRTETDENGTPRYISFTNAQNFNFAFDVVDAIAKAEPERLAMVHLDREKRERRFTFEDMRKMSARAANYFRALGVEKGDRVMLVLRRNWEFWPVIIGLHKLGAIAIPATDQLLEKDFEYRFQSADVTAIVCTAFGGSSCEVEKAMARWPKLRLKVMCGGHREGWHDFDAEYEMYSSRYHRTEEAICGDDAMLMLFSSGTTGYPKAVVHSCKYPLGHYLTAKYWHCVDPDGLHLTISDTGWGKALWGKLYGQWMCGAATFVYDFDRFHADDIMPMFAKYNITTFCAPPTMYRFFIKEDLSKYDLSSIKHASTAGEAMNPEVFNRFREATGLSIMEGFGQTETTVVIGNFVGMVPKIGAMGKPNPQYDVELITPEGTPAPAGEVGEVCIFTGDGTPCGLFAGYYENEAETSACWHDGYYHTGDLAWQDEDGYFWYVGRADDVIKSSGYRIGPFEIESVIMELPYVLECGVSAAPDEVRGQVVKASIVLVKGKEGTEELKKEIQNYVKHRTAPYKYPRIVEFREELPKTTSGKIIRSKL